MRILLVTLTDLLPYALLKVLNPANDYCAIVVDEPDIAKKMFADVPLLRDKVYPFYELKECAEKFDLALCVSDNRLVWRIGENLKNAGLPAEKFLHLFLDNASWNIFMFRRAMQYYKEHAAEFEMFATGISYICAAMDADKFKYKLFNFGRGSQDLYYDYQVAKFVFTQTRHGGGRLKYCLTGLAPYSFHYDESKSFKYRQRIFQYLIALNDLHNFIFSADECRSLFREDFLNFKLPTETLNVNNIFNAKSTRNKQMTLNDKISFREFIDEWANKNYPETVKENVQILDDYLTLCEENNVRPIMFLPIMTQAYIKYFNRNMLNEFYQLVEQAQKKHPSAVFFDGWQLHKFPDSDFYDAGQHLNGDGAAKFSAMFNNFIEWLER